MSASCPYDGPRAARARGAARPTTQENSGIGGSGDGTERHSHSRSSQYRSPAPRAISRRAFAAYWVTRPGPCPKNSRWRNCRDRNPQACLRGAARPIPCIDRARGPESASSRPRPKCPARCRVSSPPRSGEKSKITAHDGEEADEKRTSGSPVMPARAFGRKSNESLLSRRGADHPL